MWIARGHQRPHANVVPSSFVVPNVPFLMCQDTSASQLPVVGSASKLHGHPHAQLQLCIYSASKFHFVGIGRTPSPGFGKVWRILNRSPAGSNSRVRTFISTRALSTVRWGGRVPPGQPRLFVGISTPLLPPGRFSTAALGYT